MSGRVGFGAPRQQAQGSVSVQTHTSQTSQVSQAPGGGLVAQTVSQTHTVATQHIPGPGSAVVGVTVPGAHHVGFGAGGVPGAGGHVAFGQGHSGLSGVGAPRPQGFVSGSASLAPRTAVDVKNQGVIRQ